jgi:hypothetical protein
METVRRPGAILAWTNVFTGCTELGSDAEVENLFSAAAHGAVGFVETGVVRCFNEIVAQL